jgi:hypothetical protein
MKSLFVASLVVLGITANSALAQRAGCPNRSMSASTPTAFSTGAVPMTMATMAGMNYPMATYSRQYAYQRQLARAYEAEQALRREYSRQQDEIARQAEDKRQSKLSALKERREAEKRKRDERAELRKQSLVVADKSTAAN